MILLLDENDDNANEEDNLDYDPEIMPGKLQVS